MPLFQNSVVNKYLKSQDHLQLAEKWEVYKSHFLNPVIQENIRNSKEEQYQEGFLRDLFVNIFGYTLNPAHNFNLTSELKNVKDSKKVDGGIIINDKVVGVIELKGTNTTDLGKVEEQAFGYKNNQHGCTYVITSNFEKLRFYIDNAIEHLEFNLFTLNQQDFKLLYLCVGFENIKNNIPKKLKEESLSQEESITKQLYKDYSLFKRELFQNLCELNPQFEPLELFQKSQKLLDRCLFLFFAEDRNLLPPNSVRLILNQWKQLKELDAYTPLYDRFKKYFEYLNTGFKGKQYDVFAYNGGLFKPDAVLDTIKIDDDLLYRNSYKLSEYDFASEVDVNILGHIFENSLNELDEIKAQLEGQTIDKANTKRKKDGVFYTPKYITKYIVENTVGKLCEEKKAALEIIEEDYTTDKKRQKKTIKLLADKLTAYMDWLLQITICDPACGSGAFLNQALDFLINEHTYIDELQAKLFGDAMVLSDVEKSILENNLFGVDLNEESVEIAKLSLWLRTAQPNRKLNDLNNNIKCGNSLIDDVSVAGDKAFNWGKEFPQIFEKGGFDVVIGNPPYVVLSSFKDNTFEYLQNKYKTSFGRLNTFALFIEQITNLTKLKSKTGLIIPDSLCLIDYYTNLRKHLLDNSSIEQIIELGDGIFADATVPAIILIIGEKQENNQIKIGDSNFISKLGSFKTISQEYYYTTPKLSFNLAVDDIFIKLTNLIDFKGVFPLKEVIQIKIGVCTGSNKEHISEQPIFKNSKKVLQGKDINKYILDYNNLFINYDRTALLRARDESIFLKTEKLLMRQTSDKLILTYDCDGYYTIDSLFILYPKDERIMLKYLLALLNSKLLNRQYQKINPEAGRVFAQVKIDYVNELPIIAAKSNVQLGYIEKVDLILGLNNDLLENSRKFQRTLQREFEQLDKLPKKLENWYELSYSEFLKELKKKKIELSLSQKAEWEDYFLAEQTKAVAIQNQITVTDKEIDAMVYELYGLSEEEIGIIEGSYF